MENMQEASSRLQRTAALEKTLCAAGSTLSQGVSEAFTAQKALQSGPPTVQASLQLLEQLGVSIPEAVHGIRDHLRDHVRGRIQYLSRQEIGPFVRQVASAPVVGDLQPLVVEALKRLDPTSHAGPTATDGKADKALAAVLAEALSSPAALSNIPPDVILQLPPALVHLVWRAVPARCTVDVHSLLQQHDSDTAAASRSLNLGDLSTRPHAGSLRQAAILRRKSPVVQKLFSLVRGAPDLYHRVCGMILNTFESTADPKWATLRSDLFLAHLVFQDTAATGASAGAAAAAAKAGPKDRAQPPRDALASYFAACDNLLVFDKGSMENIVSIVKGLLVKPAYGSSFADSVGAGSSTPALANPAAVVVEMPRRTQDQIVHVAKHLYEKADGIWTTVPGSKTKLYASEVFRKPVYEVYPGEREQYLAAIAKPMDLGTLLSKALNGEYKSLDDLRADAMLIDTNCRKYNANNNSLHYYFDLTKQIVRRCDELCEHERRLVRDAEHARVLEAEAALAGSKAAAAAGPKEPPPFMADPSGALHVAMLLTEPALVRHAVHLVLKGLALTAKDGTPLEAQPEVLASLRILACGDLAFARPGAPAPALGHAPTPGAGTGTGVTIRLIPAAGAAGHTVSTAPVVPAPGSVLHYEALAGAMREILRGDAPAAGVPGASAAAAARPSPASMLLPLPLSAGLAAIRTAMLEYTLLRAGKLPASLADTGSSSSACGPGAPLADQGQPVAGHKRSRNEMEKDDATADSGAGAGAASSAAASSSGSDVVQRSSCLASLRRLKRGRHVHGRTVGLLALAVACAGADPPPPYTQAAIDYFFALASIALPDGPDAAGSAGAGAAAGMAAGTAAPAVMPEPCLLPSFLPALLRSLFAIDRARKGGYGPVGASGAGAGAASSSSLPSDGPASTAHLINTAMKDIAGPALKAVRSVPFLRGIFHFSMAQFLRAVTEQPGGGPPERSWQRVVRAADAAAMVFGALEFATPQENCPALQAAAAAYSPALPSLLQSGFVQPLALVWIRPDFVSARTQYSALLASLAPYLPQPFDWAGLGLNPHSAGALTAMPSATPMPLSTPTGSLGVGFEAALYTPITPAGSAPTPGSAGPDTPASGMV